MHVDVIGQVVEVRAVIDPRVLGELRSARRGKQEKYGDDNRAELGDRSGADRCHIAPRLLTTTRTPELQRQPKFQPGSKSHTTIDPPLHVGTSGAGEFECS